MPIIRSILRDKSFKGDKEKKPSKKGKKTND
jgi:hypothetical protein